MKYKHISLFWL